MASSNTTTADCVFGFDIVCPYAYMASTRIASLCERSQASLELRPLLLGGLYGGTSAPQGKDGSASDVMPAAKRRLLAKDMFTQAAWHGVELHFHPRHPVLSLTAMRLLTAAPKGRVRAQLMHALYHAYWVLNEDVDQDDVLRKYADQFGVDWARVRSVQVKDELRRATDEAVQLGAFGVPAVFVDGRLYWGQDRLHFVEKALRGEQAQVQLPRYVSAKPLPGAVIEFYFDVASPWAFLGYTQLEQLRQVARVELKPVLTGVIFRSIGTPNVPMLSMSPAKRSYGAVDLGDWQAWYGEPMHWPDNFPIRSVTPLRVVLVEPSTLDCIFRAAWQHNKNISDPNVLADVLQQAGFDADDLLAKTKQPHIKQQLRDNTETAVAHGACGVPTYRVLVDGKQVHSLVWGQDRMSFVLDLACGWQPPARSRL